MSHRPISEARDRVEAEWLAAHVALTDAEWEVVDGVLHGWSPHEIAAYLGVARDTVYAHLCHVAHKLPPHGSLTGYARVLYWLTRSDAERVQRRPPRSTDRDAA